MEDRKKHWLHTPFTMGATMDDQAMAFSRSIYIWKNDWVGSNSAVGCVSANIGCTINEINLAIQRPAHQGG